MSTIKKPVESIWGFSNGPVKYSSAGTRFASLHGLQQGADLNEVNAPPQMMPGEMSHNMGASNIKSGCNVTDLPSVYGLNPDRGMDKIGHLVFTPGMISAGWNRKRGEPVG